MVLVIPTRHVENLYSILADALAHGCAVVQRVAVAIYSTHDCQGISTRKHNESARDQYEGDQLHANLGQVRFAGAIWRAPYAAKLGAYFADLGQV
jgi:histidine triad (HIT) family protein